MRNKCINYRVENIVRKEKLLVTSNFSFSHNIFHSYISLVHQNAALCGNGLNSRWTHTVIPNIVQNLEIFVTWKEDNKNIGNGL